MRTALLLSLLLLAAPLCHAAESPLFVQSGVAKLMSEPASGAQVVAELSQGTEVTVLESNKRWHKVEAAGQVGWISRFLLADHLPLKRVSVLGNKQQGLEENARRRASAVTTAGAARGLTADQRRRADATESADYSALERLEGYSVSDSEVSNFAAEGQLK